MKIFNVVMIICMYYAVYYVQCYIMLRLHYGLSVHFDTKPNQF